MKFRKKPVEIEAEQNLYPAIGPLFRQAMSEGKILQGQSGDILIFTLEGAVICKVGDWLLRGVKGEFYPCRADIFAETYEPA